MSGWIPTTDLPATSAGNGAVGDQRDGAFFGGTIRETAGVAASVKIVSTSTSKIKWLRNLAAGESVTDFFGPDGLKCAGGMTVTITGTIEGAVYFR